METRNSQSLSSSSKFLGVGSASSVGIAGVLYVFTNFIQVLLNSIHGIISLNPLPEYGPAILILLSALLILTFLVLIVLCFSVIIIIKKGMMKNHEMVCELRNENRSLGLGSYYFSSWFYTEIHPYEIGKCKLENFEEKTTETRGSETPTPTERKSPPEIVASEAPLEQFAILPFLPMNKGNLYFSFTNSSFFMLLTLSLVLLLFYLITQNGGGKLVLRDLKKKVLFNMSNRGPWIGFRIIGPSLGLTLLLLMYLLCFHLGLMNEFEVLQRKMGLSLANGLIRSCFRAMGCSSTLAFVLVFAGWIMVLWDGGETLKMRMSPTGANSGSSSDTWDWTKCLRSSSPAEDPAEPEVHHPTRVTADEAGSSNPVVPTARAGQEMASPVPTPGALLQSEVSAHSPEGSFTLSEREFLLKVFPGEGEEVNTISSQPTGVAGPSHQAPIETNPLPRERVQEEIKEFLASFAKKNALRRDVLSRTLGPDELDIAHASQEKLEKIRGVIDELRGSDFRAPSEAAAKLTTELFVWEREKRQFRTD